MKAEGTDEGDFPVGSGQGAFLGRQKDSFVGRLQGDSSIDDGVGY